MMATPDTWLHPDPAWYSTSAMSQGPGQRHWQRQTCEWFGPSHDVICLIGCKMWPQLSGFCSLASSDLPVREKQETHRKQNCYLRALWIVYSDDMARIQRKIGPVSEDYAGTRIKVLGNFLTITVRFLRCWAISSHNWPVAWTRT